MPQPASKPNVYKKIVEYANNELQSSQRELRNSKEEKEKQEWKKWYTSTDKTQTKERLLVKEHHMEYGVIRATETASEAFKAVQW